MDISIRHIGKSAEDLRFFLYEDDQHAGGITVHSIAGNVFSYGIAVAREKRNRGVAKAALPLLFDFMKARGFSLVFVEIAPENAASLALHRALGFKAVPSGESVVRMEKQL